ncbi:MAG: hypothetical protein ABJB74_12065 [Gemmatimonas sp.]
MVERELENNRKAKFCKLTPGGPRELSAASDRFKTNRTARLRKLTPPGPRELRAASDRFKRGTRTVFKVLQTA